MSQYDDSAAPMYAAMQPAADAAPFVHLAPRIPLDEKNDHLAYADDDRR